LFYSPRLHKAPGSGTFIHGVHAPRQKKERVSYFVITNSTGYFPSVGKQLR
jgi:hypothetical protein